MSHVIDIAKDIETLSGLLPKRPPKRKKNFFDILGVRNKETINSRVIAYFLKKDEEHGLETLFFDSLLQIIKTKLSSKAEGYLDLFSGDYKVTTEDSTSMAEEEFNKKIDITISGDDWSIIIENKLYHNLDNPLLVYWQHAKASSSNVIGIVLSLAKKTLLECSADEQIQFINITHQEWINQIQANSTAIVKHAEGHFYLKEYIKTIKSHYQHKMDEPKMNKLVNAIAQHHNEVKEIQNKLNDSIAFIERQTIEVFEAFGYEKTGSWFTNRAEPHQLYFYMTPAEEIILNNKLWFFYEVRNKTNELYKEHVQTNELKNHFEKIDYDKSRITILGNDKRANHSHIAKYSEENFLGDGESFKTKLTQVLTSHFLSQRGIVEETVKFLNAKLNQ